MMKMQNMPFLSSKVGVSSILACLCLVAACLCIEARAELVDLRWRMAPMRGLPAVVATINASEQEWLRKRGAIRLGVASGEYEPLIVLQNQRVRGVAVDYLDIVGKSLGVPLDVRIYSSASAALDGLRAGEVDVLVRGSEYEASLPGLELSRPYVVNQPVLVARGNKVGEGSLPLQDGVALVEGYLPSADITKRYPEARLAMYASVREALHSVEYRRNEWMVGDAVTVAYQLSIGELPNLHMRFLDGWNAKGYSFVFREDDSSLRVLFDRVLEKVPPLTQANILSFWGVKSRFMSSQGDAIFTEEELKWLSSSPTIRVAVSGTAPPYTFYDADGNFRGLLPDLLAELGKRTGLNFTMVDFSSIDSLWGALANGSADMASVFTTEPKQKEYLSFSQPYARNSYALVVPQSSDISDLAELKGKRVAVLKDSPVSDFLAQKYPQIQRVEVGGFLEGLMAVSKRDVSAAVLLFPVARYYIGQYFSGGLKAASSLPQLQAKLKSESVMWFPVLRYYIGQYFADDLKISSLVPQLQASQDFAVSNKFPLLHNVLQKGLDQLEPTYLNGLTERWQGGLPAEESAVTGYVKVMRWGVLFTVALVVVLVCWFAFDYVRRRRKLAEASLHELRSRLLDGIPLEIVVRDLTGRLVICNQAFYRTFEAQPEQVIGRLPDEFVGVNPKVQDALGQDYFELLKSGEISFTEVSMVLRGAEVVKRRWVVPYTDGSGKVSGLIMGWMDITSSVLLMRQLQLARDQAIQASEAKSNFLAVMSHEIRTPLNAIIGLLELVMRRVDQGGAWDRSAVEVAYSSSNELLLLIGEILDLAKIESGKLELDPHPCKLPDIVESVARVFDGVARQKGLYLRSEILLPSVGSVLLDAGRLKQVISNLLSNAIKFTDAGGVRIVLQGAEDGEGHLLVSIEIEDSGSGISPEDQARLFQPFSQAKSAGANSGGTGLGLVICRQLIEMMGGSLRLESALGRGSRIRIDLRLPLTDDSQAEGVGAVGPAAPDLEMQQVLIVDDHLPNRLLLRQQLMFLGHQVSEAEDGQQAFSMIQLQDFDVIITDCNMPVMDGYELTKAVRTWEQREGRSQARIIGFTANAQLKERQRCLDVGMDECLFKPVQLDMLHACLGSFGERLPGQAPVSAPVAGEAEVFDWEMLGSLVGTDRKVLCMLFGELQSSNDVDLRHLDEGIAAELWREQRHLVHRLKGAARMVGAKVLIEAALAYESALAAGEVDEVMRRMSFKVRDALVLVQKEIKKWIADVGDVEQ